MPAALEFTVFFTTNYYSCDKRHCGKVLAKMLTHQNGSLQLLHSKLVSVVPKLAKTNKTSSRKDGFSCFTRKCFTDNESPPATPIEDKQTLERINSAG